MTVWKWSSESRYPGAFPPVLENFFRAFSPGPTDRAWVSEDERSKVHPIILSKNVSNTLLDFQSDKEFLEEDIALV